MAAYMRRSDRAFRIGGDEFALILSDTDVDGAQVLIRRLLAACLDGESGRGADAHRLVLGRDQRRPDARPRPRVALPPGGQRAVLEQASRPDLRDHLRLEPRRPRDRAPAGRTVRGRRAGRRDRGHPGRLPADLRSLHRRAARLRGPRPAAPRQRLHRPGLAVRGGRGDGRTSELDIACLQHGHGDRGPAAPARDRSRSTSRRGRSRATSSASTRSCG